MSPRRLLGPAAALVALVLTSACGSGLGGSADSGKVTVAAAFYPLEYAVSQVGGDLVEVQSLTKPGAEPHDLELNPRQVAHVALADLVVYEKGFQPAVDDAVRSEARHTALDVSAAARLDLTAADETESAHAQHDDHAAKDPHFWLDPLRYADVGDAIGAELGRRDPAHAAEYTSNAKAFRATMTTLDRQFRSGLEQCRVKDLVTAHAAFGYLARAYGLTQQSITGLTPDAEPSPAALADITDRIRRSGAATVYAETLVSEDVARTLARETGARLAVLDPLEGITTASAGRDYPSVMRANLATLEAGQECS
ncbi:metal ABC transporter solute-binding protein, Zn/Mn family [Phycicoccus sp. Soil748]|uniref:metal ABC transporter substrate-binding protein n=1 Tax=Phycicoccus sp. Soil748 TaxID=1736397 RepID=UPI000AEC50BB|nr:zinc ABC transporter substrate-binding protein [Phycicoccus sp. Soil748]